jgi:hypothetical protein
MKITLDSFPKHLDRACLGKPRRALDQQVTIRQDRDQEALDQVVLTDYFFTNRLFSIQYFLL